MDAYSAANWTAVLSALAGASAALTGLLFVALSINLKQIIEGEGLVGRAVEVLILLASVLIASVLLLMPGQGAAGIAIEVLMVAALMIISVGRIQRRAPRRALGVTRMNFANRVIGAQLGPVLLIVGGVTLLIRNGGGLYWVVPGLLAALIAGIVGAWVMLVEIVR